MKKIIAALMLLLIVLPVMSYAVADNAVSAAEDGESILQGECGKADDSVFWYYYESSNTLCISGRGEMCDYSPDNPAPWIEQSLNISIVVVQNGIKSIGEYAFYDIERLRLIELPYTLERIGYNAFGNVNMRYLNDNYDNYVVRYYGTLKTWLDMEISEGNDCINYLAKVDFEGYEPKMRFSGKCGYDVTYTTDIYNRTVVISGTGWIGSYQDEFSSPFSRISRLEDFYYISDITIDGKIECIGGYTFCGCDHLSELILPESVSNIYEYAFKDCTGIKSMVIPKNVTDIEEGVFENCSGLEEVILPENIVAVRKYAFRNCSSLESVNIPSGVTIIEERAFEGSGLKKVMVPEGISYLSKGVFNNCTSLGKIYLPSSLKTIQEYALVGCDSLTDIYYQGSEEEWQEIKILDWNRANRMVIENANIHFNCTEESEVMLGDVNNDKIIDIRDVTMICQYILEMVELDEIQYKNADVISDNMINIKDLGQLKKYLLNVIDRF
ncbi:MAG: leucine-rich repeat protein [Oscillospiraceae bacterium]